VVFASGNATEKPPKTLVGLLAQAWEMYACTESRGSAGVCQKTNKTQTIEGNFYQS